MSFCQPKPYPPAAMPPARTIEQYLDELIEELDSLPATHPERPALAERIAQIELHLLGR